MHVFFLFYMALLDGGSIYVHRCLRRVHQSGVMEDIIANAKPGGADGRLGSFVASVSGAYMTFLVLVYFVVINLAGFLGLVIPTIINEGGDSDESMQPFSANWTVNFDVDGCWVHPVGGVNEEIFYNVSEAENACLEFGPKICAGVGSTRCDASGGKFHLCDATWMPIFYGGSTNCAAAIPSRPDWVEVTTYNNGWGSAFYVIFGSTFLSVSPIGLYAAHTVFLTFAMS